jgi:2-polyprenyl-3-methyl-5-hydroxy-6-metoxy-1,4-benzoquinol methylase
MKYRFNKRLKTTVQAKKNFDIWSCNDCGHLFTNPRVKEDSVGPYYDNPDYISHTDDATSVFAKVYQILRGINLNWKHGYVAKYAQGKSLLDYGCGTGQFLEKMVQKGYSVQGR